MTDIGERIKNLQIKEYPFETMTVLTLKSEEEKDKAVKIAIFDKKIYLLLLDYSIRIYDCMTLGEIATLKFGSEFNFYINNTNNTDIYYINFDKYWKAYVNTEILENEMVLILCDRRLYFFKMNLKEKKFDLLYYLSDVYHFCYLEKKKEIFLITEMENIFYYVKGVSNTKMAKSDLEGNILFSNGIKPKKYSEFKPPEIITEEQQNNYNYNITYHRAYGFNNDKYIIHAISENNSDKYCQFIYRIYNANDLNQLFQKMFCYLSVEFNIPFRLFDKIGDNLFWQISQNSMNQEKCCLFYYNEKENNIKEIGPFKDGNIPLNSDVYYYSYLNDNMTGLPVDNNFSGGNEIEDAEVENEDNENIPPIIAQFKKYHKEFFYIIDLTSNNIIRKYKISKPEGHYYYYKLNKDEYLFALKLSEKQKIILYKLQ